MSNDQGRSWITPTALWEPTVPIDGAGRPFSPAPREHLSFAGMKLSIFCCSFKCRNEIGGSLVQQVRSIDLVVKPKPNRKSQTEKVKQKKSNRKSQTEIRVAQVRPTRYDLMAH
jgi:hypothetical protein